MGNKLNIIMLMAFLPIIVSAQDPGGQVRRPVKKQQTTSTTPTKKTSKPSNLKERVNSKTLDADGYDVTINCNVPSASMIIDGNYYGKAGGSLFLKNGSHTIGLNAEGYDSLLQVIQVNQNSLIFSFELKKKMPPVIQNLINNMVNIEGGTFYMGEISEPSVAHQVTLDTFSIGKYEVTQEEWSAVMGKNPSHFEGGKRPVENVSWNDCQEFIHKLNELTGKRFRLPTESEWEYAAKGGNRRNGYKYSGSNNLGRVAWYEKNSNNTTHDVGQKSPNELGLYDMSGNVYEWCQDFYGRHGYPNSLRVSRGGDYYNKAANCLVHLRLMNLPDYATYTIGLRLAL